MVATKITEICLNNTAKKCECLGLPPVNFTLPLRWAVYPLKPRREGSKEGEEEGEKEDGKGEKEEGRESWHVAFHGIQVGNIR